MDRICYTYVDDAVGDADVGEELDLGLHTHITLVPPLNPKRFC